MPPPEAVVINKLGVEPNGKAQTTFVLNGHGGPLRSVLTTGQEMIVKPVRIGAAELTQREMKIHALPELSVGTMKKSAGIDNDGLPSDAIHVDTLLSATKASAVLKLFGEPEPVGVSGKVHQVKVGESTITAYDGSQTLVLTHTVDKETQHSFMLNGGILRDIPADDREKGQPFGREIILAPQEVKTTHTDGITESRRTVTVVEIEDGEVFATTTQAGEFQKTDPARSKLAESLEPRSFTLVEGDEIHWKGAWARNDSELQDELPKHDRAKARRIIDEGVDTANKTINDAWSGLLNNIKADERSTWPTAKGEQDIEGITLGESVPVIDVLKTLGQYEATPTDDSVTITMGPYDRLFSLMGVKGKLLSSIETGTKTSVFEFPVGNLTMNTNDDMDNIPLPANSTLAGWGQVGLLVHEDKETGRRSASLLIKGRGDKRDETGKLLEVEQVDLSNAQLTVTQEPNSPIGLGVQFTIPGEQEGQPERVVTVHTSIDKWRTPEKSGESFMGHVTDIFTPARIQVRSPQQMTTDYYLASIGERSKDQ